MRVSIGGAVPRTVSDSALRGESHSRLILQETARIRLAAEVNGRTIESFTDYAGAGTQAVLRDLLVGTPLTIRAETIDTGNNVLTSWSETLTLSPGVNSVSATLRPDSSSVTAVAGDLLDLANLSLTRGTARFFSITFSYADAPNAVNEYQIIANTASFRSCWLAAYDADWKPIAPIASETSSGWTVIQVPQGGGTVNVAISAPNGDRSATLQARKAMFFCTAADGGSDAALGTSRAPRINFQDFLPAGTRTSFFIKDGRYSGSAVWSGLIDCRIYGGFSARDWALRDPSAHSTLFATDANTGFDIAGTGCLDGMTVRTRNFPGGVPYGDRGVNITSTQPLVIHDCAILGPEIGGDFISPPEKALSIEGGTPQIVNCRIDGGNETGGAGNAGVYITGGRPFIDDCEISGGYCSGNGASNTWGVYIESGSAVINDCTIFGGTSKTTSTSAAAYAMGVYVPLSPSAKVVLTNSVVSGGYCSGPTAAYSGTTYGVYSNCSDATYYPVIANCSIDAGKSLPTGGTHTIASIYSAQNTGQISASGNVLLISSSGIANGVFVRIGSASLTSLTYFRRFAGNSAFGPLSGTAAYSIGNATGSLFPGAHLLNSGELYANASYLDNRTYPTSPTTATAFAGYGMGRVTGASTDFDNWLTDNHWRPAAGMASYFAGAYNPVSSGDIPAADLAAYPELMLDRAGRLRSATAPWARGAYEP